MAEHEGRNQPPAGVDQLEKRMMRLSLTEHWPGRKGPAMVAVCPSAGNFSVPVPG